MIESNNDNQIDINSENELDINRIFEIVKNDRKIIFLTSVTALLISVIYSLSLSNYYVSESILTARDTQQASPMSEYSGLASIAGINIPNSGASSVYKTIEMIQSREFARHLITFDDVLPSIMAAHSYDHEMKKLNFDEDIYDEVSQAWTRKSSQGIDSKPSYLEAHKKILDEMLSITYDDKTGLIVIRIEHISPVFAKDFLSLIITETNQLNRIKDMESSTKALNLLKKEQSNTSLLEIKQSINKLIETQLEIQMLAGVHEDYMLISVDPPFIPEIKSRPSRSVIVVLTTIFSAMLSIAFLIFRDSYIQINKKI